MTLICFMHILVMLLASGFAIVAWIALLLWLDHVYHYNRRTGEYDNKQMATHLGKKAVQNKL